MASVTISGTTFEVIRVSDYWLKVRMPESKEFVDLVAPDSYCISWRFVAPEPNYFLAYMLQKEFCNTGIAAVQVV